MSQVRERGDHAASPARAFAARRLWAGVALAVALLAASGAARDWQSRRVNQILRDGQVPPFTLSRLPDRVGPWTGVEETLDPEIAKMTGATQIVNRVYRHKITGQVISLALLFGPSSAVYGHSPEICYPANGYGRIDGPDGRTVAGSKSGASWPFFRAVYAKGEAGAPVRKEVYWTWRYSNQWTPYLTSHKGFERIPGMFKVHVDRVVRSREELGLLDVGNPCESFLALLMPEIDRLLAESAAPAQGNVKAKDAQGTPR